MKRERQIVSIVDRLIIAERITLEVYQDQHDVTLMSAELEYANIRSSF